MPISNDMIQEAVMQRILDEIKSKQAAQVINNVYGGGGNTSPSSGAGGVFETLGGAPSSPATPDENPDMDYYVDILRKDLNELYPNGKPKGWEKKVHRYIKPKGSPDTPPEMPPYLPQKGEGKGHKKDHKKKVTGR